MPFFQPSVWRVKAERALMEWVNDDWWVIQGWWLKGTGRLVLSLQLCCSLLRGFGLDTEVDGPSFALIPHLHLPHMHSLGRSCDCKAALVCFLTRIH